MGVSWLYRLLLSLCVVMSGTCSHIELVASSKTVDTFDNVLRSVLHHSVHDKVGDRVERLLSIVRFPEKLIRRLNDTEFETTEQDNRKTLEKLSQRTIDHGQNSHRGGFEGRKVKAKKHMMMRMLIGLKIFIIGLVLPAIIGMALFASWKGMTISLMALLMASIIGMKNLIAATKHDAPHILLTSIPSHQQHQHWWRKSDSPEIASWDNPHELVYRGHR